MTVIGLIGCGNWGRNILRDLIQLHCQVCVADIDSEARSRATANGAFEVVSRWDELPDCDGYVVAVPIPELTAVTSDLLKFKKPIFSEKTLCLSMNDFELLRERGEQTMFLQCTNGITIPALRHCEWLQSQGRLEQWRKYARPDMHG